MSQNLTQYLAIKKQIREESNAFPYGFAFSDEQFDHMMEQWGYDPADTDKIIRVWSGAFIRKADKPALLEMYRRHDKMREDALAGDKTGEGYIYEGLLYEMQDHEYLYSNDAETVLDAVGLSLKDLEESEAVAHAFELAERAYFKMCDDNDWW